MVLRIALTVAAALVATGLYGALSQQSIVMIMMGLELVVNGLILGAGAFWWAGGGGTDASVLVVVLVTVMAVEMALGFAVALALYRARQVDLTDDAAELAG
ncbi:NADH-quinone oxidoreductase subunit K [Actinomycetospora termitidis]|uniref:NADH-quinone oxidoreductase subunit K n=1 Tax=Actinomycetospora termitidis TaxID=3053470 RepID=A0ABT7MF12_9PSEU|nr:NADH-quinone oxidoreductase subunit K [Actinomycetospora sp. Odt1-22]MDL5158577.1 NADH-quinone oxidoreductase subunit K [Actinomycetospora sp. Odt1-22]